MSTAAPRRRRRWLAIISVAVLVILSTAFAVLRLEFEGPALADKISKTLNKRMRGRIEIGSVEWPTGALKEALTGGWVEVTMRDVKVWDDCALNTGAPALDDVRWGDPNEDCTLDERPDPDPASKRRPRKLLLRTELITAEIDAHAIMFGNHDFVFRNIWVHGGEALLEQTREPYPLHAYDRTIVSIVTAFYPRMKGGFRAGIFADPPPPVFDLRDIHVQGLNLTVHMTPDSSSGVKAGYVTTARLEGVDVDADPVPANRKNNSYLYMDPVDPLVAKFYVRLEATAKRGTVRLWDDGMRDTFRLPSQASETYPPKGRDADYEIGLTDIKLNRLAQLPGEWARKDYVAKTLELDIEARTVPCATKPNGGGPTGSAGGGGGAPGIDKTPNLADGASLHVTGELFNYWDRPYDGSWNIVLDGKNMGPTVRTCIKSTVGGDNLDGRITLSGPFVAQPKIGLAMKNLDFDVELRATEPPLRLTLAEVQGSIDLVNEQGSIDTTTALIRGGKEPGEVVVAANFGLKPYNARAHVEIVKAIDVSRFLPPSAKPIGGFLQGRLTAVGDAEVGFALEDFDLALGRTEREKSIRVHKGRLFTDDEFDTVTVQQVQVEAGQSRARVDGTVDIKKELLDITVDGHFPDLDVWLARFGLPQFIKSAGAGIIKIKGPISNPTINVATELGGVPCLDKVRIVDSQFNSDTRILDVRRMQSGAFGGTLQGSARVRIPEKGTGRLTSIEKLHVEGRGLDAAKICEVGKHVKGTIDFVDIDLAGTIDPKRTAMEWMSLAKIKANAKRIGVVKDKFTNVAFCLNRTDDSACRPRTAYLDNDDLAQCEQGKKSGFCAVATATRDGGGQVDATVVRLAGNRPVTGPANAPRLAGTVALSDVPVSMIDELLGVTTGIGGLASVTLHLQGSPDAPQAHGAIQLLRAWAASSFLGDAQLAVTPVVIGGRPGLAINGSALAGRLQVKGAIGTEAPYPVELAITGRRVEADVLVDLQKAFDLPLPVQAWASGTVTLRTELRPVKPVQAEAWVELDELVAIVTHKGEDGRITPIRLAAVDQDRRKRAAVSLRMTAESIDFKCRDPKAGFVDCTTKIEIGAQAGKPAGVIDFRGHVTRQHMAVEAIGKLDLAPIAPLVDTLFTKVTGSADITASITGTFAKPKYEAELLLKQVEATPVGGDTVLEAPSGLIRLANGSLGFTDVKVRVRDPSRELPTKVAADPKPDPKTVDPKAAPRVEPKKPRHDESGEVHIKGLISLDGLKPTQWNLLVDGKLAGKMLLVLAPDLISQASGIARIEGNLLFTGKGPRPTIAGTLVFDELPCRHKDALPDHCYPRGEQPNSITVIPRGLRRELAISKGSIEIGTETEADRRTYTLKVNAVTMTVDAEGTVSDIDGYAEIRDGELIEMSLRLDAEAIPFRIPGTLDLVVSAGSIAISKPNEHANLDVRGDISIIDGTYRQNFEIAEGIRSLGTSAPPSIPIWDIYPLLGNANLELDIEVRKFALLSNIAQIDLAGDVQLSETPKDPRLSGQIRVERGRFKLPGMRAAFTSTTGNISFNKDQRAGNPELRVVSDADYRDLSGQDHVVTLTIEGYLDTLKWDLKTSTGYNKSQSVSLLLLGRNPEQLRRSLGDQSLGSDPTVVDPTTNPSQGFADQIVKDLAGDWVSTLLENSLTRLTGLDVLRLEVGFGSIGLHLEKRLFENINLLGTGEQTIKGRTLNVRGEVKTPYDLSLQGGVLKKDFSDPAEEDISDYNLKLIYRIFIP